MSLAGKVTLLWALACAAMLLRAVPSARPVSAESLPPLDGRIFLVKITTRPLIVPANRFIQACDQGVRAQLEATAFEFVFAQVQGALTVSITTPASTATASPEPISGDPLALTEVRVPLQDSELFFSATLSATAGADGRADAISLDGLTGTIQTFTGDVVNACAIAGSGLGVVDSTAPTAAFEDVCDRPERQTLDCVLLPEAEVVLRFSKPVQIADVMAALSAVDEAGAAVALLPDPTAPATATRLAVYGYWPLGGTITVSLAAGVRDLAGNRSVAAAVLTRRVAADPGPLPDGGFETGTLAGFTAVTEHETAAGAAVRVVDSWRGVTPAEGAHMVVVDPDPGCHVGTVGLVARLTVPAGATALALDDNLLVSGRHDVSESPLLLATVRTSSEFRTVTQPRPASGDLTALDEQTSQSDWQEVRVPVDGLEGQEVVLTLRLEPSVFFAAPPACFPGSLLLDNLRFE